MSDNMPPGNGSPNSPPGTSAPLAPNAEEMTEMIARVASQVVNAAWTARSKKLREEITADFKTGFDGLSKQMADMATAPEGKGKKGAAKEEPDDPKMNGMQRQLADLQKAIDDRDRKLAESETKSKQQTLRSTLNEELAKAGITDPTRQRIASTHLISQGFVFADDEGNPIFAENQDSHLDLATGVRAWSKGEEAKIFLPTSGARGSGDRPGQGGTNPKAPSPQDTTSTDLGLALIAAHNAIGV